MIGNILSWFLLVTVFIFFLDLILFFQNIPEEKRSKFVEKNVSKRTNVNIYKFKEEKRSELLTLRDYLLWLYLYTVRFRTGFETRTTTVSIISYDLTLAEGDNPTVPVGTHQHPQIHQT